MVDSSEQLDRLQTALFASGDVVYDWDLIDDLITWVGRTEALFGGDHQYPRPARRSTSASIPRTSPRAPRR